MGQVLQAGVGQAPARQAALAGGPPEHDVGDHDQPRLRLGLKAIMLAAAEIRAGDAEVAVAGGMESMNQAPYLLPRARFGYRLGDGDADRRDRPRRPVVRDRGLPHGHARRARRDQRRTSAARTRTPSRSPSHQKAIAAIDAGRFDAEMAPVTVRDAKGRETVVDGRTRARAATRRSRRWRACKPAFALPDGEDRGDATTGTVTAGNAPGHHRRRGGDRRRERASRRAARADTAGPDRRLRPGGGRARSGCSLRRSRASGGCSTGSSCRSRRST